MNYHAIQQNFKLFFLRSSCRKMICFLLIWVILPLCIVLHARTINVSNASAINNGSWISGDTLLMTNGNWNNQKITLKGTGNLSNPIVLQAQTAGQVKLCGSSIVTFSGQYLEIKNILFEGIYTGTTHIVNFNSNSSFCRLSNCAIKSYNITDSTKDYKWISIKGRNHRIDHCFFENKTNSGTLLVVWLEDNIIPSHRIDHNYFSYRIANLDEEGEELNGQEIIRIGDSSTSMQSANCTVEYNFFENCDGEIEIISNKSCGNHYFCNTFYNCAGMLTLRHGNNCMVEGNFFFGNDKKGSGGVRIIGENHTVINNYFQNLKGNNYRAAISIIRGKENSALSEYFQVKNALIANNTMVNCTESFCINYNSSSALTLPPVGCTIISNHVYNDNAHKSNKNIQVAQTDENMDVTYINNLMNQGKYTNYTVAYPAVITGIDAKMATTSTSFALYEPTEKSGLTAYKTSQPTIVIKDIFGRTRPTEKLPGCSEIQGTSVLEIPYSQNTGPEWMRSSTATPNAETDIAVEMLQTGCHLYWYFQKPVTNGHLQICNIQGQIIVETPFSAQTYHVELPQQNNIYFIVLQADKKQMSWKVKVGKL